MTPILTAAQVAELLCCSPRTVEDYAREGRIPGAKFGDSWVFAADLVVDAVKRISLEQAAKRATPAKPVAIKRRLPGLALMPASVREVVG